MDVNWVKPRHYAQQKTRVKLSFIFFYQEKFESLLSEDMLQALSFSYMQIDPSEYNSSKYIFLLRSRASGIFIRICLRFNDIVPNAVQPRKSHGF